MGGHEMNFIRAIRGEETISHPFDMACPLNETMLLGIAALRAEQPIEYDGVRSEIMNSKTANAFLDRPYRKGWELLPGA
jgi:hypothetical protein